MSDSKRTAAQAIGATRYDPGFPCRHGHASDRYASNGACVQCHKLAMAATKERYRERHSQQVADRAAAREAEREVLRPQREAAQKEYRRRWRIENAERVKQVNDAWRAENAERARATTEKWRKLHPERIRAYTSAWAKRNPEKERAKQTRRYEAMSVEQRRVRAAKFHARNPDARRRYGSNYKARKLKNGGVLSKGIVAKLLFLQRGRCACCGRPLASNFHLDHIVPLALGGSNTDDNVQLLRQRCNNQKRAKHPIDFMQSRGFLL